MSLYPYLAKNILLFLGDLVLHTNIRHELNIMEKNQWLSIEELQEYQNKKLRSLIRHSYNNVPYFHNVFRDLRLYPDDIKTSDDLKKLPVLTKSIIRENSSDMLAKNFDRWHPISDATSGSTGKPLQYWIDARSWSGGWASIFRGWGFAGYTFGDKRVTLAGSALMPGKKLSLKQQIRIKSERNLPLSAVHMSDEILNMYIQKINKFNPRFLRGYPSAWYSFAQYFKKKFFQLKFPTSCNFHYCRDALSTSEKVDRRSIWLRCSGWLWMQRWWSFCI